MNAPLSPLELKPAVQPLDLPDIAAWTLSQVMSQAQALAAEGHGLAAAEVYRRWLAEPTNVNGRPVALFNYGAQLQQLGRPAEALAAYQDCVALNPALGPAWVNLGLVLERAGRIEEALVHWGRAAALRHLRPEADADIVCTALNHIGRVQEQQRRYDVAERALRESLQINSDQSGVIQHWIHIRQKACLWPVYDLSLGLPLNRLLHCTSPLAMLALTEDPLQQLSTAQAFVQRTYVCPTGRLHEQHPPRGDGRIRIGLLSADLRSHAVGFLLPAFLDGFDRRQVDLYAYDDTRAASEDDPARQAILTRCQVVRPVHGLSDAAAAACIADDRLDILIDLHGLSSGARPGILALRPAPRQGTYLGYIGTTALPWVDFVLVDRPLLSAATARHLTERPVFLDTPFIPLTRRPVQDAAPPRAALGLPVDAFVMASFGNVYKITPELFAVWLDLLRRIPEGVLWLLDDNPVTTANLRRAAVAGGIAPGRLIFAARIEHEAFRARLRAADVILDTYPYNGGSTTNDVLDAGVPLVTRYGPTMISRMGLSSLTAAGQGEHAVDSFEAYADAVVSLWLKKGRTTRPVEAPIAQRPADHSGWIGRLMRGEAEPTLSAGAPSPSSVLGLFPQATEAAIASVILDAAPRAAWLGFGLTMMHRVGAQGDDPEVCDAPAGGDAALGSIPSVLACAGPDADVVSLRPLDAELADAQGALESFEAMTGVPLDAVLEALAPGRCLVWRGRGGHPMQDLSRPWLVARPWVWRRWLELRRRIAIGWGESVARAAEPILPSLIAVLDEPRVQWWPHSGDAAVLSRVAMRLAAQAAPQAAGWFTPASR